jgi:predicted amidophosphoribosyltransferase
MNAAIACPHCGSDNPSGKKFCGDCGAPLVNRCPQCDAARRPRGGEGVTAAK